MSKTVPSRPTIFSHRDLIVWQKARWLAVELYRVTGSFPPGERFGLTAQLRRAGVSVVSNIAEGHSRQHRRDFVQFISMARGSIAEIETQLDISELLGYTTQERLQPARAMCDEISRMLTMLSHRIRMSRGEGRGLRDETEGAG